MIDTVVSVWWSLFWVLAALGLYAVCLNRVAAFTQPFRLRLADRGEYLLSTGALSAKDARQVHWYLDHAFSGWVAPLATLLVPILVLPAIFVVARARMREDRGAEAIRHEMERLAALFAASLFAANPIFGTVLLVEFAMIAIIVILATANSRVLEQVFAFLVAPPTSSWFGFAR